MTDVLPRRWADDRFLGEMLWEPVRAHHTEESVVVEHTGRHGPGVVAVGDPDGVARLLEGLDLERVNSITVPRGTWELLSDQARSLLDLADHEDWDWMDIDHVPRVPHMDQVRELDRHGEVDEIMRVRQAAIPDSFLDLDRPGVRWFGWFDHSGILRAIGGAMGCEDGQWPRGAHFGSIGTEPDWQGRGVGAALTAGMVAQAFTEGAVRASLGVYAQNHRAIDLYQRLGFVTTYRVHSRSRARS